MFLDNYYNIPIKVEVVVSRIAGKIRLQYSTDPSLGSFLQFLGRPAIRVDVEPVVGQESQVNLKSFPKVSSIITRVVNKSIDELCYPQFLQMDIPCTTPP
jgi:Ca2+-dependent lipid-binding protein